MPCRAPDGVPGGPAPAAPRPAVGELATVPCPERVLKCLQVLDLARPRHRREVRAVRLEHVVADLLEVPPSAPRAGAQTAACSALDGTVESRPARVEDRY